WIEIRPDQAGAGACTFDLGDEAVTAPGRGASERGSETAGRGSDTSRLLNLAEGPSRFRARDLLPLGLADPREHVAHGGGGGGAGLVIVAIAAGAAAALPLSIDSAAISIPSR